jgi:hypothetical protein
MTYTEFKNKWIGKGIDFDGSFGNQCMDVYRQYVKEVLLCPQSPPVQGAKNVWDTYLPQFFDRIENTVTGVPQEGDIVIWGMNPYGHIAICDHATASTLTCFEQNWTEQDGSGVSEIRLHGNYNNVLGWLHFKEQMTEEQKRILDFLIGKTEGDVREAFGALADSPNKDKQIQVLQEKVLNLDKFVKDLSDRVVALESDLQANLKLVADWQSQALSAKKALDNANKSNQELIVEKNKYKGWYETALKKTIDKYTGWQLVKLGISKLTIKK